MHTSAKSRKPAEPLGTGARRAALRLLDAVLRRGEALETALPGATRDLVSPPDRGLAHAIAAEVLRRMQDLDLLIDSATRQRLPDDAKARMVLRIALIQPLALGTPPHAAIATVLPLVDGGPRKLVHGVFGSLMRANARLGPASALPPAVKTRWEAAWGSDMPAAAGRAIAAPPPLDLTLRDPAWNHEIPGLSLAPGHWRIAADTRVPDLPGFDAGAWWVQDVAASLPARLIGKGSGHAIDLCAAPGGKTMQLAAAGWRTSAVEISESRARRLRENLARTRLTAEVVIADARRWAPDEAADAVLVDAPCSATGIFRRHPDVLYRAHPGIIAEMADLQRRILARAADWVKPGGTLVYATCSLETEEGEAQLAALLAARDDYAIVPPVAGELPEGLAAHPDGYVRTLPGDLEAVGGCDGFFVVRLRRASA